MRPYRQTRNDDPRDRIARRALAAAERGGARAAAVRAIAEALAEEAVPE